uniref:Uncharacterized protein n=1 Tax=Cucumis melo TaxID=3656 RepID=A0A9I9EG44_CUCME
MPTFEHGNCSKNKIQKKERVSKKMVKETKVINVPLTLQKLRRLVTPPPGPPAVLARKKA